MGTVRDLMALLVILVAVSVFFHGRAVPVRQAGLCVNGVRPGMSLSQVEHVLGPGRPTARGWCWFGGWKGNHDLFTRVQFRGHLAVAVVGRNLFRDGLELSSERHQLCAELGTFQLVQRADYRFPCWCFPEQQLAFEPDAAAQRAYTYLLGSTNVDLFAHSMRP